MVKFYQDEAQLFTPKGTSVEFFEKSNEKEEVSLVNVPMSQVCKITKAKVIAAGNILSEKKCRSCDKGTLVETEDDSSIVKCSECSIFSLAELCDETCSAYVTLLDMDAKMNKVNVLLDGSNLKVVLNGSKPSLLRSSCFTVEYEVNNDDTFSIKKLYRDY